MCCIPLSMSFWYGYSNVSPDSYLYRLSKLKGSFLCMRSGRLIHQNVNVAHKNCDLYTRQDCDKDQNTTQGREHHWYELGNTRLSMSVQRHHLI